MKGIGHAESGIVITLCEHFGKVPMLRNLILVVLVLLPIISTAYRAGEPSGFSEKLTTAALERTKQDVVYDPAYLSIPYPNGDVPKGQGVCTDVVIRSYRALGVDLQVGVHEEMSKHFDRFPKIWGLSRPDKNIDHRRVPNLQTLFERKGVVLSVTDDPKDYLPGDLVTWTVPPNLPHIGIVVDKKSKITGRPMVVHNIGMGPELEDMLFSYPITGHYRYSGSLNQ